MRFVVYGIDFTSKKREGEAFFQVFLFYCFFALSLSLFAFPLKAAAVAALVSSKSRATLLLPRSLSSSLLCHCSKGSD